MICIFDKTTEKGGFDNNGLAILDECISATINNNLNGDYSLEILYPVTSHKAKYLEELNIIKAEGQLFRIYKVERSQADNLKVKVWARHIFYDLAFFFIESAKILNANMKEAMEMSIPPEVQAVYSIVAPEGTVAPFAVKEINSVDAMFRLIEVYGGEVDRDNFNITIQPLVGVEQGILIRYGKNIKGLTLTLDSSLVASRIYPVGDNELVLPERYIEIKGIKPLPFDITKKVEFKECKDVESLRAKAIQYAETAIIPKVNIAIDFIELSKTEEYKEFESLTRVNLGDMVDVYHEKLGLTTKLRVVRKQIDIINPINTKIELGDPLDTIIEKLDTSKLLDEITKLIEGNKSGVVIKKNSDVLTIGTSKYAAMVIGFTTKADTNLNCTVTLTGKALEQTTLSILFSLDGVYYDLKPVQKLAAGDNVLGFTLPMPQVQAGSHSFIVELWVSNGSFIIEKNNLQISIEGLHIEGGLSATLPRIEVVYTYLYTLFYRKINTYAFEEGYFLSRPTDDSIFGKISSNYSTFISQMPYYQDERVIEIALKVMGIVEEFSRIKSLRYEYDAEWVDWDSDFDKKTDGNYESYNRATIKEPIFEVIGTPVALGTGAVFSVALPNSEQYQNLVSISTKLVKEEN